MKKNIYTLLDKTGKPIPQKPKMNFDIIWVLALIFCAGIFFKSKSVYPEPTHETVRIDSRTTVTRPIYKSGKWSADRLHLAKVELSEWDKFRLAVYASAGRIKDRHEDIPLDTMQLYDYLMKTIYGESKYKVGAVNKLSNAKGILQWMPSKRAKLGVPENIDQYPLHEQARYIPHLFNYEIALHKIDTRKIDSFDDVYSIVFAPAFADASSDKLMYVSCTKTGRHCKHKGTSEKYCAYHANRGYDKNKDGAISKWEPASHIINKHYR